jgi:hypothetical protein
MSDPSAFVDLAIDATASIDSAGHPEVIVTNIEATQRAPQSWSGHTIESTFARIEDLWEATWDPALGRYAITPGTGRIQVRATLNGATIWNRYVTAAAPAPTLSIVGDHAVIDARFQDMANDLEIDVHLELDAPNARPTSSITPLSSLEPECTSPDGATVTLRGHADSGVPTTPVQTRWYYEYGTIPDVDTVTLQAPMRQLTERGATVRFSSIRGVHAATTELEIRALDRVAPTILRTRIQPPCGWGTSGAEPNPQVPEACARVDGIFTDTCSLQQSIEVLRLAAYEYPSGAVLSEVTYGNGENRCITPIPGFLDANLSNVDYEVDYRVRDASGNWTPARRWRGWFYDAGADGACADVIAQVTLFDGHL